VRHTHHVPITHLHFLVRHTPCPSRTCTFLYATCTFLCALLSICHAHHAPALSCAPCSLDMPRVCSLRAHPALVRPALEMPHSCQGFVRFVCPSCVRSLRAPFHAPCSVPALHMSEGLLVKGSFASCAHRAGSAHVKATGLFASCAPCSRAPCSRYAPLMWVRSLRVPFVRSFASCALHAPCSVPALLMSKGLLVKGSFASCALLRAGFANVKGSLRAPCSVPALLMSRVRFVRPALEVDHTHHVPHAPCYGR
jgi:hypothetical protein